MNVEIERLIKFAVADGLITDKERSIILRKAETLGEDKDEVELILDGELALLNSDQKDNQPTQQKSNKEGVLKKCPSCGAPVQTFRTKCSECDHEFRNIESEKSIQELFSILQLIETEENNRPRRSLNARLVGDQYEKAEAITRRQAQTISSFPFPNSKQSILEFLAMALPQTKVRVPLIRTDPFDKHKYTLKKAWLSKCEQIIIKARFVFQDDKGTLEKIESYSKQLGFK